MSDWYDRTGKRISIKEAGRLLGNRDYQRVELTQLDNGLRVSTVWLGLDHSWGGGPPLIFETMVFDGKESLDCERYSTEAEAVQGHYLMCNKWGDVAPLRRRGK